ncbi:biofilm regulation diguanylate cyclase SiaD [Craterilacuibacter sp.]|uniref:biofilm regulation diguanylate cyclase SiaD n=1 Tax=Craterilacuibacter sp. TaxID=2870909 RepID=UPI003F30BFB7
MASSSQLEQTISSLLADPQWQDHPLHDALSMLFSRYRTDTEQLERLTRISDRYQKAEYDRGLSYAERHDAQLKRLERLLRISDRYQHSLQELNKELRQQSEHDELTGLHNRRYLLARLRDELARQTRGGPAFAVALGDVDHFKRINDLAGHEAGDLALCRIAGVLRHRLRQTDACARWGGEEFLLLLPMTSRHDAVHVVQEIMHAVAALEISPAPGLSGLTMSFGLAHSGNHTAIESLLSCADQAMYQAKDAGRNRLVLD